MFYFGPSGKYLEESPQNPVCCLWSRGLGRCLPTQVDCYLRKAFGRLQLRNCSFGTLGQAPYLLHMISICASHEFHICFICVHMLCSKWWQVQARCGRTLVMCQPFPPFGPIKYAENMKSTWKLHENNKDQHVVWVVHIHSHAFHISWHTLLTCVHTLGKIHLNPFSTAMSITS